MPTQAPPQPAAAAYVRHVDDAERRPFAMAVLRIEDGRIVEVTLPSTISAGAPRSLPAGVAPMH